MKIRLIVFMAIIAIAGAIVYFKFLWVPFGGWLIHNVNSWLPILGGSDGNFNILEGFAFMLVLLIFLVIFFFLPYIIFWIILIVLFLRFRQ